MPVIQFNSTLRKPLILSNIRCKVPQLLFDPMNKCLEADPQNRPTARTLASILNYFFQDLSDEATELYKQFKDLDENFITYDKVKLTQFKYQTHLQAIYTNQF
ncbi:hypothetical protein C2G38_2162425 [Gigaspora rosea]|uniref:Protein kinase domain-containing protein n=1 Tax=Gigaspora rosea TaxID=44941 RepID=A0A397W3C2_9GLOM|nr:hypothetical protein C2G38_2162425 [Gigaspora rosea]